MLVSKAIIRKHSVKAEAIRYFKCLNFMAAPFYFFNMGFVAQKELIG